MSITACIKLLTTLIIGLNVETMYVLIYLTMVKLVEFQHCSSSLCVLTSVKD